MFSLFAEDIGLLPDKIFSEITKADADSPERFQQDVTELFAAMQGGGRVFLKTIPWVNGGLFAEIDVPLLTTDEIAAIEAATRLDWSQIEPAIFGTLFERSLDPTKRSQLGAHYTSKQDIERVVEPVVMDPLRREWVEIQDTIDSGKLSTTKPRGKPMSPAEARIVEYLQQLRGVTVLDPACGSGNFLYVALNALLTLEKEVMTWRAITLNQPLGLPEISPKQLKGIEINIHAQQLAQAAIWIGYLQWLNENGFGWEEPILDPLDSIEHRDALLTFHDDGTVTETEWPAARFIIGNPPFLGPKGMRDEIGDEIVEQMHLIYGDRVPGMANLCTYWTQKAGEQLVEGRNERVGLLATANVRFGADQKVLSWIETIGGFFLGWTDLLWPINGTDVRISIYGFDGGFEVNKTLDGQPVEVITSALTSYPSAGRADRLEENRDLAFAGIVKGAPFDIDSATALAMLHAIGNPHGRPNSDVVRPWVIGQAIAQRRPDTFIIDFGVETPEQEAALYEAPFEYARMNVWPAKQEVKGKKERENWWLHNRPIPGMRDALKSLNRFIATLTTTMHRVFVWLSSDIRIANSVVAIASESNYLFGALHSRVHTIWAASRGRRQGVGNNVVYSVDTFESFPFPWPPRQEPLDDPHVQAIGDAAKALDDARNTWLNPEGDGEAELKRRTLTNLYNANPTWLKNLHVTLDRAVWDAYGWPAEEVPEEVEEDVVLSRLLALNIERAGVGPERS